MPGWMPRSLRTWFATTGRWAKLVMTQNQVLSGDHPEVEDGKLVVWVENQGVWEWGVDPDSDDPEVYDRENEDDEPWQPCTCRERHLGRSGGLFDVRPDLGRTDGRLSRSSP